MSATEHPADIVFTGGAVFTAEAMRPHAHAVAVRDGRIIALEHDVDDLIGSRTEVVDLRGGMLVPGFQDAHVHPVQGGLQMLQCDLRAGTDTQEDYLRVVAEYVRTNPDAAWVQGGGWSVSAFAGGTPTAATLDAATGDKPAFLPNRDGHGAWVNTAALRLAGIDRTTPDPADGRIQRDADGKPTGTLHEGAMALVNRLVPEPTDVDMMRGLLRAQEYLHSLGVTAWQDAIIGEYADLHDAGQTYLRAAADGMLTARVIGAIWWDRTRGLEQIPSIVERRERYRGGRFAATSVKVMQDGVAENFTAAMLAPYLDGHGHPSDNIGISFVPPEILNEAVPRLDALGFQVHFHAIGDRAVRQCLDAVERAVVRNGFGDNRHHIAHVQIVHPDDIARLAALHVTATIQALWATLEPQMIDLTLPFLGEPRSSWQYPFGDLLRAETMLAAGSDWPVSTPDPLAAIHTAVNRTAAPGQKEGDYPPFLPEQALDLAAMLTAYTAGSAWVNHLDGETGTIATGKAADLVVLDRDPFAGPVDEIGTTRVLQTFIEGQRVFAAADA